MRINGSKAVPGISIGEDMSVTDTDNTPPESNYLDDLARELHTLRCPSCHGQSMAIDDSALRCENCDAIYPLDTAHRITALIPNNIAEGSKGDIKAFWGDLYKQLYASTDNDMTPAYLEQAITDVEDIFLIRGQNCVVEMPYKSLDGAKVLEIGSGAGSHSCIFKRYGAHVTSVDITPERAVSTAAKLAMLKGGQGIAFNADAENLPFKDATFDYVYSNGVLHHSPDTEKCIDEVYRVLKPGGTAVIMLYSRISSAFLFNILPRGILTGEMFRWPEAEWIGRLTEGKPKFDNVRNPITRVYTKKQMTALFHRFQILSLRKWSFQFDNFCVPRLTQIRRWVLLKLGYKLHKGGTIVYGQPIVPETPLEVWLGQFLGFGWAMKARKPETPAETGN